MSVQRWPDTLIIYLKRFVFEHTTARKIETEVIFDLENLTLDELGSLDGERPDSYNLIGSIQVKILKIEKFGEIIIFF